MDQIEKTVFLSYRRKDVAWALLILQDLSTHGFDVFFDFASLGSGDFERVILANIKARAHFLVLLTPSALEPRGESNDWLRREIEAALITERNIIPVALEGFRFSDPAVEQQLNGSLSKLSRYNALTVHADYFSEAMAKLRERHLAVRLAAVLHPVPESVREETEEQQAAAAEALRQYLPKTTGKVGSEDEQFTKLLANLQANGVPVRASAPSDAGPSRFGQSDLDFLIRELAPYIGPMARVLVKRSARRVQTWTQLCELLANEMPEGVERKRFLGAVARAPKAKPL